MKKLLLAFALVFALVGCQGQEGSTGGDTEEVELFGLSKSNPMVVDKDNKTIKVFATVNGKYLDQGTRHAVVSQSGKFGDKSVFQSHVAPWDYYQALLDIGAEPGNNMVKETAEETYTEGTKLKLTFTWEGQEEGLDINDVILDSNGKPIEIRFSGNLESSKENKTGCITCLDSCPVGISSNATYTYGSVENKKIVEFRGNKEVLPPDGTPVVITYTIDE